MKICLKCGIEFDSENKKKAYCSKKCYRDAKAKRHYSRFGILSREDSKNTFICEKCKNKYIPTRRGQKYCSLKCAGDAQKKYLDIPQCLESASRKLDKKIGYVRVYCPMHPEANTWGYVYEHRLIMEGILGRHLVEKEVVHHINGKRWDNSPENLQVMMAADHSKLTNSMRD